MRSTWSAPAARCSRAAHLQVTVLYDEPRVLLLPAGHRLAGKESVTLADIADEPLPRASTRARTADRRRAGRSSPRWKTRSSSWPSGQAVAIIPAAPAGVTGFRADLTTVPLEGVTPSQVAVATRAGERNPLVAAFRDCAREFLTGPEG